MFSVLVFLLGARAATIQWISLPKASEFGNSITSFFPIIFKNYPATSAIPSGVLYVFPSTSITDGDAGGRSAIQQICPSEDPDAHFCSLCEIENAWATTGIFFSDPFPQSWLDYPSRLGTFVYRTDGYPERSDWYGSYNCDGWTSKSPRGKAIYTSALYLASPTCAATLPVACCKRIP